MLPRLGSASAGNTLSRKKRRSRAISWGVARRPVSPSSRTRALIVAGSSSLRGWSTFSRLLAYAYLGDWLEDTLIRGRRREGMIVGWERKA